MVLVPSAGRGAALQTTCFLKADAVLEKCTQTDAHAFSLISCPSKASFGIPTMVHWTGIPLASAAYDVGSMAALYNAGESLSPQTVND